MQERVLIDERLLMLENINERLSRLENRDPVLAELGRVLWEFVCIVFHPSPYGLRQIAEVFIEVRRILLADDLAGTLTQEAIQQIKFWIENTRRGNSYDLVPVLRDILSREV